MTALRPLAVFTMSAFFLLDASTPNARAQARETQSLAEQTISVAAPAELTAVVSARCDECAWDVPGREAVTLRISLDGHYSQHLPLVRTGEAEYPIALGRVGAGRHSVRVDVDAPTTAVELRGDGMTSARVAVNATLQSAGDFLPLSFAPFVYARPNTVGRFTDAPILMWYETSRTSLGTRYQYSVIFTNEDGGTQTDRLMATWGRTTDIEYIYSVEVNAAGTVLSEEYQGPDHQVLPFQGQRDGRHPLLWVATDNNMVSDAGDTTIRYAPRAVRFDLTNTSREAVMDAHPWTYAVAARELLREGKIAANPPPGAHVIVDPRRYVYIEACTEVGTAAIAFGVLAGGAWISSDNGLPTHRIMRDGCARGAVPLPDGMDERDVRAVRVAAFERPPRNGQPQPSATAARLTRINTVFVLNPRYVPTPMPVQWRGVQTIEPGSHFDLPIQKPRPIR